jgi:putative membrane protein
MDYAATDLLLAIVHHLLVFTLAGILAFEIGTVSVNMQGSEIRRVGRVDLWYGILAGVIIIVGFLRATVAAKGWAYYSVNLFFWLKIATFLVIGLLSIPPTVQFIRWQRARLPPMPRSAPIRTPSTMSAASSGWRRCCSSCSRSSPPPWPAAMANWHEVTRALMLPLFPMGRGSRGAEGARRVRVARSYRSSEPPHPLAASRCSRPLPKLGELKTIPPPLHNRQRLDVGVPTWTRLSETALVKSSAGICSASATCAATANLPVSECARRGRARVSRSC